MHFYDNKPARIRNCRSREWTSPTQYRKWRWRVRRAAFGGTGGASSIIALRSKSYRQMCRKHNLSVDDVNAYFEAHSVL